MKSKSKSDKEYGEAYNNAVHSLKEIGVADEVHIIDGIDISKITIEEAEILSKKLSTGYSGLKNLIP